MSPITCASSIEALLLSVRQGSALSQEHEAHLATCELCAATLDAASRVRSLLAEQSMTQPYDVETVTSGAVREVERRSRFRRVTTIIAGVAVLGFLSFMFVRSGTRFFPAFIASIFLGSFGALLIAVVLSGVRTLRGGGPGERSLRLYKRLRRGYQLSGVCLGLSERTGIAPGIFRLIFVALACAKGTGIVLYILLDLVMPVHPDDRRNLLRFRLRRWLEARTG